MLYGPYSSPDLDYLISSSIDSCESLGKDTGSGQPVGFSGWVGQVRVVGQSFSRPEPVVPVRIHENVTKSL
jgi:hypothetical protein